MTIKSDLNLNYRHSFLCVSLSKTTLNFLLKFHAVKLPLEPPTLPSAVKIVGAFLMITFHLLFGAGHPCTAWSLGTMYSLVGLTVNVCFFNLKLVSQLFQDHISVLNFYCNWCKPGERELCVKAPYDATDLALFYPGAWLSLNGPWWHEYPPWQSQLFRFSDTNALIWAITAQQSSDS